MRKYFWNILISIDQLLNTLLGGYPDETISSRAGKAQRKGKKWGRLLCSFLNIFENKHCQLSIEEDEGES